MWRPHFSHMSKNHVFLALPLDSPKASAAVGAIQDGTASVNEFLVVLGVMAWERTELEALIAAGELELANQHVEPLLEQVWALADAPNGDSGRQPEPSDGAGLWWASCQGAGGAMQALPSTQLGDECLAEWLKFFAGHDDDEDEDE